MNEQEYNQVAEEFLGGMKYFSDATGKIPSPEYLQERIELPLWRCKELFDLYKALMYVPPVDESNE